MTTELVDHRPTPESIEELWGADRKAAVLTRIREGAAAPLGPTTPVGSTTPSRAFFSRRRALALASAAAAGAIALTLGPSLVSPDATPSAEAVAHLVRVARDAPTLDIPEGKYLHRVVEDEQRSSADAPPNRTSRSEGWTARDGQMWRVDAGTFDGRSRRAVLHFETPPATAGSFDTSLAGLHAWPTSAEVLEPWMRERLSPKPGATEDVADLNDQAIAGILTELLAEPSTPAGLRAASIEVLAGLPQATASAGQGRTRLVLNDPVNRGLVQTLTFDSATARLVDVTETSGATTYRARTTVSEIVDAVPAEVLREAVTRGNEG